MGKTMKKLTAGVFARVYLLALLVFATLFSSVYQLGVALGLIGVLLYLFYKPVKAGLNVVLVVGLLVFAPLVFEALVGVYGALLLVPALLLLDEGLRGFASSQGLAFRGVGRSPSGALRALVVGLLLVFVVGVVVWNLALLFGVVVLLCYVGVAVLFTVWRVSGVSLREEGSWSRVVVGNAEAAKFRLMGRVRVPLLVSLRPVDAWVSVAPSDFLVTPKAETEVSVKFTAPLAGPSKLRINACYADMRGLVEVGQVLEPLDLHIIPRARYAAWLANKFLEQTSGGGSAVMPVAALGSRFSKRGVEFFGSRAYQVGDSLKDIDWKHSFKLGELVIKEFSGLQGQSGVIVANLTAKDADEADLLAYNLVMSALTLASEGLPSALAVYNETEVLAATPLMSSRETLKRVLELTGKIVVAEPKLRVLESTKPRLLKRSITQLSQAKREDARRLAEVLELEAEALEASAESHPATLALNHAVKGLQGQAVITVISPGREDSDALSLALEKLKDRGFSVVFVGP